jgi:hypothetical protein
VNDYSRIRSSKTSPTRSRSRSSLLALLTLLAAFSLRAADTPPAALTEVPTRDQKVVRRWQLAGSPRGVAVANRLVYVGLAERQAVVAIDPKSGVVQREVVLDNPDIASTKELVTLRTNADGSRLFIANGSDESATILTLPDLKIVREITLEGETIRDALPDPQGRYLYLLGRRVHVFDAAGSHEIHTLPFVDPMAIAATNGTLAVIGSETFGSTRATSVALYDTKNFDETARDPLQTTDRIEGAVFTANALVAISREHLFEKPLVSRAPKTMTSAGTGNAPMRMSIDFGDLINSDRICLPDNAGPQILAAAPGDLLLYAERRCSSSGAFAGSQRRITPASLYGVTAYAVAYDRGSNTLAVTDPAGYLTIYKVPRSALAK